MLSCAHAPPLPLISPGGRLEVINATDEDVEVFADGQRVMVVEKGLSKKADRLPLGPCEIEAAGLDTGLRSKTVLTFEPDRLLSWRIEAKEEQKKAIAALPRGGVKVRNLTSEPVRIFIDNYAKEMIWPSSEVEYGGIRAGLHHLRAEGVKTGRFRETQVVVSPTETPLFEVHFEECSLEVRNSADFEVFVSIGEMTSVHLEPGAGKTVTGLPCSPATVQVSARDMLFRPVWSGEVALKPNLLNQVLIPKPKGVLAVISDLDEEVSIIADGRLLGRCDAHGGAEFRGLAPGKTTVSALDREGEVIARNHLVVPEEGQAVWMLKGREETYGEEGSLLILNSRTEPVLLRVDGVVRGRVGPGGRRLIPRLVPGLHTVEALGERSRDVTKAQVKVLAGDRISWEVREAVGILSLKNSRSEPVRVLLDGDEVALLAPSESKDVRIPAGRHRLEERGTITLSSNVREIDVPPSVALEVSIGEPKATLVVINRFSEALELSCGDRGIGTIGPSEKVVIRDLEPGLTRLNAKSLERPLQWSTTVFLEAGQSFEWEISQ